MIEGLWTIEFVSDLGLAGKGVIVIKENQLLGGDAGYYYVGKYSLEGSEMTGEIDVIRFSESGVSVFGNVPQFTLHLIAEVTKDRLSGTATFKGQPTLAMKFKAEKKV